MNIIDQCVAQGVPFAREYGGTARQPLLRRRPGLAHLLRARPDRPAAPARRLPGPRAADRPRQGEDVPAPRDARADRDRRPGPRHRHPRHGDRQGRVAPRRRGRARPPAATATSSSSPPTPRAATPPRSGAPTRRARPSRNPCYTQIHPTCIPVTGDHQSKLTLMSESLRNDGRIWVPKKKGDTRPPAPDPRGRARLLPRAQVPELRQPRSARHRLARRQAGLRRGPRRGPDRPRRLPRLRRRHRAPGRGRRSREKYGNLFEMYERITDENPYKVPMRIYPASHYTMGGLWVDYNLMSTIPGLHVIGEANFSDHGANRLGRLGAHAGAGRRLLHPALHDRATTSATSKLEKIAARPPRGEGGGSRASRRGPSGCSRIKGKRTVDLLPPRARARSCGSTAAWPATRRASRPRSRRSPPCARSSGRTSTSPGSGEELNQSLEKAGRVADFLELGELMCRDALEREESCGGHFREEYQTEDGEALRDDDALLPRRGLGVRRAKAGSRCATSSRWPSRTSTCRRGATSDAEPHPSRLAAEERAGQRALRHLRRQGHQPRHVVPRDARRGERAPHPEGRGARSPSTTTAARASAAPAAW